MPRSWQVTVDVRYDGPSDGSVATSAPIWTPDDPTGATTLLPIRLGESEPVLVVVPDGTAWARAVRDESIVDTAGVVAMAAVVDAASGVLGSARPLGEQPDPFPDVVGWW
ncbi:hypothetical protein AB0J74_17550 [Asanoa sp. NPDC049573]|uniref:hypothetical protein n=1 Tax=Asanoa sp. NPDC049573 TaxID=3155396 RepID=UPI0034457FC3